MARNVGGIDRAVRVIVGLTLLGIGFFHVVAGTLAVLAYLFGVIALATAVFAYCPAWVPFGINTSRSSHVQSRASGSGQ
ncbi:MAG TPA: DUF2892 domain-containing protein [Candidatus Acidoferrales bacterium]|jgi:hypothetical protein|nr:DUF2892 domain-containing protein [Candidatus Acidoferrales bacterium]